MPLFESAKKLGTENADLERARTSLREELETIDCYREGIEATGNTSLRQLFERNMNEDSEHAAMLAEWLRSNDPAQDSASQEYGDSLYVDVDRGEYVIDYLSGEW